MTPPTTSCRVLLPLLHACQLHLPCYTIASCTCHASRLPAALAMLHACQKHLPAALASSACHASRLPAALPLLHACQKRLLCFMLAIRRCHASYLSMINCITLNMKLYDLRTFITIVALSDAKTWTVIYLIKLYANIRLNENIISYCCSH